MDFVGAHDGMDETEGAFDTDGCMLGLVDTDGGEEGAPDGEVLGIVETEGAADGLLDGMWLLGLADGCAEGTDDTLGELLGLADG